MLPPAKMDLEEIRRELREINLSIIGSITRFRDVSLSLPSVFEEEVNSINNEFLNLLEEVNNLYVILCKTKSNQ